MYENWMFAFWRELFQNSTDARCNRIDVELTDKGNGLIGVSFRDNGHGMSRETLENVYFKLGETTKNTASTVGGFGRARILTCFSMKNYTIHTQGCLVQGDGGDYEIVDVDDHLRGCLVQVEIEDESFDEMQRTLHQYLCMSQMFCDVYVNGEKWVTWLYRRQLTRSLVDERGSEFANVYVNKSGQKNLVVIRVDGTAMYSRYTSANAQVIVEILPHRSREVLTANRDGMHSSFNRMLNRFVDDVAVNTMTALKPEPKRKNATVRGRGLFCSVAKREEKKAKETKTVRATAVEERDEMAVAEAAKVCGSVVVRDSENLGHVRRSATMETQRIAEFIGGTPQFAPAGADAFVAPAELPPRRGSEVGDRFASGLPDVYVVDETDEPAVRKVIEMYNPEQWVVTAQGDKTFNKGSTAYKLLMLWKLACQFAVDALMKSNQAIEQVGWGIGWVFSDDAEAKCSSVSGGSIYLLNPVDKGGRLRFSLRDQKSQKKLMALAKHEVAHTLVGNHNEEYAALLTDIDQNFDEREVYKAMREFLNGQN
jgi:hypothetical protein